MTLDMNMSNFPKFLGVSLATFFTFLSTFRLKFDVYFQNFRHLFSMLQPVPLGQLAEDGGVPC